MKPLKISFEVFLVIIVLLTHAYVVFAPANTIVDWYTTDDVFYYFKPAQNITEGYGVTFDRIGRANGFHPLWMLVCIPIFSLARFDLILPLRMVIVVLTILNAGTGILLYRLLKRLISKNIAAFLAIFWVFSPRIFNTTVRDGMESGINALFIILLLYLVAEWERNRKPGAGNYRQIFFIGIAAIFTLFSRLDNIFLVSMIGLWILFRSLNLRLIVFVDIILVILSVFFSYFIRSGLSRAYYTHLSSSAILMIGVALVIKLLLLFGFGLYWKERPENLSAYIKKITAALVIASAMVSVVMLALFYLDVIYSLPRSVLAIDGVLSLLLIGGVHTLVFVYDQKRRRDNPTGEKEFPVRPQIRQLFLTAASYFGPLGISLGGYMTWSYLYFGTPMPVSGQIKRWWGTIYTVNGLPHDTLWGVFGITSRRSPWHLIVPRQFLYARSLAETLGLNSEGALNGFVLIFLFILAGIAAALLKAHWKTASKAINELSIIPLFVACFIQIANYNMTSYVNTRNWYWVAEMVVTILFLAVLLECIYLGLKGIKNIDKVMSVGYVIAIVIVFISFFSYLIPIVPWKVSDEYQHLYLQAARDLEAATEPGDVIGSTGGGSIGYFVKDRTIVNLDGLINSYQYFQLLKSGDANSYLDEIGLDYVYANYIVLEKSEPYTQIFKDRLKYLDFVGGSSLLRYLPPPTDE
ncbi:MAG: hypothetical protein MUO76_20555 [Anaerolineaceae bacterium]|nr:hypothetical protein [Anaerolineaceae bacterium]